MLWLHRRYPLEYFRFVDFGGLEMIRWIVQTSLQMLVKCKGSPFPRLLSPSNQSSRMACAEDWRRRALAPNHRSHGTKMRGRSPGSPLSWWRGSALGSSGKSGWVSVWETESPLEVMVGDTRTPAVSVRFLRSMATFVSFCPPGAKDSPTTPTRLDSTSSLWLGNSLSGGMFIRKWAVAFMLVVLSSLPRFSHHQTLWIHPWNKYRNMLAFQGRVALG